MQVKLKRIDKDFNIEARNDEGNSLLMDGSKEIGGNGKGMRPMQLILAALVDVVR
jgi:putative redox protein